MLTRKVRIWGMCSWVLVAGCDDGDGGDAGTDGTDGAATLSTSTSDGEGSTTGGPPATTGESESAEESSTGGGESGDGTTSGGSSSGGETTGSESGTSGEVVFDEEFVWVADFVRGNCVSCHATNANGNLILPSADMTNEEVRAALDGVQANTGLLLVEPGDRNVSQTYLQITNEFGAQFPVELTNRFGEWIDAGANYYVR